MTTRTVRTAAVAVVAALVALLVVGWGIDAAADNGQIRRHVRVAGHEVGGFDSTGLDAVMNDLTASVASTPVEITTPPSNKPPSADSLVAFADVRLEAAFDEKTAPGSKEALLDMAREGYQKALKQEPENAAFLDSMAWVLFRLKQPKEALEFQLQALKHQKEPDATLHDHLGDIYLALKEPQKARDQWEKALSIEPSDEISKKLKATPAKP